MAISQNYMTILEQANRSFNGEVQKAVEILAKKNQWIEVAAAFQGNDRHSTVVHVREYLPEMDWRGPNEGGGRDVSKIRPIREPIGVLDSFIQIDELILDPEPNKEEFIMTEVSAHLEAMSQKHATAIVYGSLAAEIKGIDGYRTRYNALSEDNVHNAGGTGGGSVYTHVSMVEFGRQGVFNFYPLGSDGGIKNEEHGMMTLYDANSKPYRGYEREVQQKFGLAVGDQRALQLLVNVETTGLAGTEDNLTNEAVIAMMVEMKNSLPSMGEGGDAYIFVNRKTKTQFDVWALNKANNNFTMETLPNGSMITRFQGIPVRMLEAILNTEAEVS